ncbi:MAG TPA: hypothetical protein VIO94_14585, partial [Phenylobacterium sp.]
MGALLAAAIGGGAAAQDAAQVFPEHVLAAAAGDAEVARFYSLRGGQAAWSPQAEAQLIAALQDAPRHGLNADAFMGLVAEDPSAKDRGLTLAALRYAQALSQGVVDPDTLHDIYELQRNHVDVAGGLARALDEGHVAEWLAGLAPQ